MLEINEEKYSTALQKFLKYSKEEADFVACNYMNNARKGIEMELLCFPNPDLIEINGEYFINDNGVTYKIKFNE